MTQGYVKPPDTAYALRVDEVSSSLMYVGEASPGSTDAQMRWRIKRIRFIGTETIIEWADGNKNFDNAWDLRTSYDYT